MSALLPKTAKRFGVKPNSSNRNEIAESATALSINANTAKANKNRIESLGSKIWSTHLWKKQQGHHAN